MNKKLIVVISASALVLILVITLSATLAPTNDISSLRGQESAIVGGTPVSGPSVYPFFVFLDGDVDCAGTLVAPDIVLTAAQCLTILREGGTVTINKHSRAPGDSDIERTAVETIVHPSFDFPYYDFGIIRLDSPVFDVQPVPINTNPNLPITGDPVTVIGLGNLEEDGAEAEILQEVTVNAVANAQCQRAYTADIIDGIMICGGVPTGGRDACNGDAGGPLMDATGNQIGIVSSGNGCARPGFPGIYARVSWAANWIVETICDISLAAPGFCAEPIADSISAVETQNNLTVSPVPLEGTVTPQEFTDSPEFTVFPEED